MKRERRDKFDHAAYSAPFRARTPTGLGPDYLPISPRTGRAVAQSTAERDWAEGFHSLPTQGHDAGGLWDHEEERKLRGRAKVPLTLPRYDDEAMRSFVDRAGHALTAHEWEIYTYFWVQRQSYKTIADRLGRNEAKVYQAIKRLRVKLAGVTGSHPRYPHTG